ncbi:GNAT family N-acetyltransferase [Pseudomonas cannabina]|uniref:GNAT family acetyltransferase n=3 Tax=Pseudomonas syringae group TaxID=136849 RepID=A0A3M3Q633_PSECA|nr:MULTISPECIES: GNAT family N-acetyltransferase [Pseudomonas syringae group]KPB77437.1 GNAT family acetyltransferase [Pseudomonas syringae pv. maculicola]MBM0140070.1 GNAT family N-acetyltransferase [Pseudomonas cannabina pv. alisalensis]QHE97193.1 GNAT family N-acetyltransferase [Pseudomonas syringae pv. maculicola str. ES4326]QQN19727.1 GNAT family N-acetyltransferase [Pseudomonas cannabina pv. alisalensis]RMN79564.1 GNAT family acetyltransferase [Pseudomonas cannabina]
MTATPSLAITLRDATPDDACCLSALGMQVFLDTYATQGIRDSIAREALDAFAPQAFASLLAEPANVMIRVAEVQRHLIGFAQVALRTDHSIVRDPDAAELQRLYVQERFTGRGAGGQLLEAAEQWAARKQASLLWATVWSDNQRALRFYPRKGYEVKGFPHYEFQGEIHGNSLFAKVLSRSV